MTYHKYSTLNDKLNHFSNQYLILFCKKAKICDYQNTQDNSIPTKCFKVIILNIIKQESNR